MTPARITPVPRALLRAERRGTASYSLAICACTGRHALGFMDTRGSLLVASDRTKNGRHDTLAKGEQPVGVFQHLQIRATAQPEDFSSRGLLQPQYAPLPERTARGVWRRILTSSQNDHERAYRKSKR